MEIIPKFYNFSLGSQLQGLFIFSSSFLIVGLILVARFGLLWIEATVSNNTDSILSAVDEQEMLDQMILNSFEISIEFKSYLALATFLANLNVQACENMLSLAAGVPIFDVKTASELNTAVFVGQDLSAAGYYTVLRQSAIDPLFPYMFSGSLCQIYTGMEQERIFHIYPATQMPNGYNPTIRDWYYIAKPWANRSVFTEPYIDASKKTWIITASHRIDCHGIFSGVAGVDITLESITNRLLAGNQLSSGFFMLVSASGIVITIPKSWHTDIMRLNDTQATGFSADLWNQVLDLNTPYTHKYSFRYIDGSNYFCFRNPIMDGHYGVATHFLFICAEDMKTIKLTSDYMNTYIFWTVFSIAAAILIGTVMVINYYARNLKKELIFLLITIESVFRKSLCSDALSYITIKPEDIRMKMFGLVQLMVRKIKELKGKESAFEEYQWSGTRPSEVFLYDSLAGKVYPINGCYNKIIKWKRLFIEIIKKTEAFKSVDNF